MTIRRNKMCRTCRAIFATAKDKRRECYSCAPRPTFKVKAPGRWRPATLADVWPKAA